MDWPAVLQTALAHLNVYTGLWVAALGSLLHSGLRKRLGKLVEGLLDGLEKRLPTFAHALANEFFFRRRYAKTIYFEHRVFNVRGLRTMGTFTLELEQVFVQLRISNKANPHQLNRDLIKAFGQGKHQIWDFLRFGQCNVWDFLQFNQCSWRELTGRQGFCRWRDMLNFKPRTAQQLPLAIIGAPGCGKTTLLQHVALTLALHKQCRYGLADAVPLLLFLRQHVPVITQSKPLDLADVAQAFFADIQRYPHLKPPEGWFKRQLLAGRCVVLLDGLDEVAETGQRQLVSQWVMRQVRLYPQCVFVVTSRPHGYQSAPLEQAHLLEVQSFKLVQIKQFVENWYLANEFTSFGGRMDDGVRSRAAKGAKDLLRRVQQVPNLSALMVNPLLLTMIAMVHRYRGQLPGRRVELYSEICDVLLGHWRSARGIRESLTAAQKRAVLQPLAKHMMQKNMREISFIKAMQVINKPLQEVGVAEAEAQHFLVNVQASSGLLLEGEAGVWRFAHLTFQEYLASAALVGVKIRTNQWVKIVENSWWMETARLYAAQEDATTLVRACLQCRSVTSLTLAAACLQEALKLDAAVRAELEQLLETNLEAEQPELRRLAAEVKLQRRLQNLQRLDGRREIDIEPLSCAEYQLFLDDMREHDQYHQPDHWLDYQYPSGQAKHMILGMRHTDAQKFCDWLNERQVDETSIYRLPSADEIESNENYDCWLQDGIMLSDARFLQRFTILLQNTEKHLIVVPYPRARTLALHRVFSLAIALELSLYVDSDLSRALLLALSLDLTLDLEHSHALDLDLNLDLDLDSKREFDLAHTLDLNRPPNSTLNIILALALVRALLRSLGFNQALLDLNINQARTPAEALILAYNELEQIQTDLHIYLQDNSIFIQRKAHLLNSLLDILQAKDKYRFWSAWRTYAMLLTEYIWLGYVELEKQQQKEWQLWQCTHYAAGKENIQQLHWHLKLTQLRQEGKLPAWEAIRIVRERRSELDEER